MTNLWVDANIMLRFLTGEPSDLAQRAFRLIQKAESGEVTLRLSPIVIAEVVWVLSSFYKYSRVQIAEVLLPLVVAEGILLDDLEQLTAALKRMANANANVDFIDAYLAEIARQKGETIVSFDRDFKRLEIDWVQPE